MTSDLRYSLEELAQVASVPERQIRELVRLKILPAPSSQGRGATYGAEHLDRLRAWKALREKMPPKTTNEQIRKVLDTLSEGGVLRAIAEGRIPFELHDDGKDDVTVGDMDDAMYERIALDSPYEARRVSQPDTINESALQYLASMSRRTQVTVPTSAGTPRVELGVGDQSGAGLPLRRLYEALRRYVTENSAEVRVKPPKTEMWHRVNTGNDIEISARGPLMPDEIQLLETVGQLLQQAIYRKEK